MTIIEFCKSQGLTLKDFCKRNRLNYGTIRNVNVGLMRASPDLALKIEKITDGNINRLDLLYPKKTK